MESEEPKPEESSALEQFRQEWQQEVSARSKQQPEAQDRPLQAKSNRRTSLSRPERPINKPPTRHPLADIKDDDDYDVEHPNSDMIERIEGLRVKEVDEDDFAVRMSSREPKSALEHYERAVEKESQGSLGDSLTHYRKAYRLDAKVDQSYRDKHFPGKWKASGASSTVQTKSSDVAQTVSKIKETTPTFEDLIASYAGLSIPGAKPIIEGDREPPCYIRRLPTEVLIELLTHVAIRDPSVFVRLALVCKRLAFHVFTENAIWKRVALGQEFGLSSQHYQFATDVQGREAIFRILDEAESNEEGQLPPVNESIFTPGTNYRDVFQSHPRMRFSGVYISTVNYTRAGGVSATPGNWASTVHIVTYYRYLRFFKDGTLISLLTTSEPIDVVYHLTKNNLDLVRPVDKGLPPGTAAIGASNQAKEGSIVPTSVQNIIKYAQRGRWRLCHPSITDPCDGQEIGANVGIAGDLHLETEGAAARYTYTYHLSLKSGSRSKNTTKNNKLVWKGFWKYNHLTDDWAEFTLKNDKPFIFSRVKSYGLGY